MPYMLLIVEPRGQRDARTEAEGRAAYASMQAYAGELQAEGRLLAVESLVSDDRAARVQLRDGRPHTLDGPFTEAKEMVGGFFLIDCPSHADAVAIAARCPAAAWATVEVRAVGPCFI
jgi:hypothetical protein